ncbi:MAG: hypothetical protein AB1420_15885 [Bacillota bacterium]
MDKVIRGHIEHAKVGDIVWVYHGIPYKTEVIKVNKRNIVVRHLCPYMQSYGKKASIEKLKNGDAWTFDDREKIRGYCRKKQKKVTYRECDNCEEVG